MFFIQRKAFNYITVSYHRVATLLAFPVLNDKGVASTVHTGCPENTNQGGRILRLTNSDLDFGPKPSKVSIEISLTSHSSLKCNKLDQ
jgi:hypothetical protein